MTVTTRGADGEPVGRALTLRVLRFEDRPLDPVLAAVPWLPRERKGEAEITVSEHAVATDEETGRGTVTLTLDGGGRHVLRATGADRFGRTVTGGAEIMVSDEEDATRLRLFAETATLQVGGQAVVRVHSRLEGALALVTIEGERILGHRVMPVEQGFNDLDLNVGHEHFPNFRVSVAVMDENAGEERGAGRLREAALPFTVERRLQVAVEPEQETYQPGERARVRLIVTDQLGRPVRAEFSLALVNEALFALYPDLTPAMLDFFQAQARRHAEFRTISTIGFHYTAQTEAVDEAILAEGERLERVRWEAEGVRELRERMLGREVAATEPEIGDIDEGFIRGQFIPAPEVRAGEASIRHSQAGFRAESDGRLVAPDQVRRELPDEGVWLPAITTDEDGEAEVEFDMPERTAQWRLTARGGSVETLVGEATAEVRTRRDFFVEIKSPAVAREGDELRIATRIHNLTDYAGDARLTLIVNDLSGGGEAESRPIIQRARTVTLSARKTVEAVFDGFEMPAARQVGIEVYAVAGDHRDALSRRIEGRPWGLEYGVHRGGTAAGDASVHLALSEDRPLDDHHGRDELAANGDRFGHGSGGDSAPPGRAAAVGRVSRQRSAGRHRGHRIRPSHRGVGGRPPALGGPRPAVDRRRDRRPAE